MAILNLRFPKKKKNIGRNDTVFMLTDFALKNVVSYNLKDVRIMVTQKDFQKKLEPLWLNYKEGVESLEDADEKFKKTYIARFKILDSVRNLLINKNVENIIYLEHKIFAKLEFRPLIDFEKFIEGNNCAIFDDKNVRHFKILRKLFSKYYGPKDAYNGRRYFIKENDPFFYEVTDEIS